ncbi:hypothetical protein ACWGDE_33485 [Streptomyces sp. NPDC054956]
MPLHTDWRPPAHFRARVAEHGRLTHPVTTEHTNTMTTTMTATTAMTTEND